MPGTSGIVSLFAKDTVCFSLSPQQAYTPTKIKYVFPPTDLTTGTYFFFQFNAVFKKQGRAKMMIMKIRVAFGRKRQALSQQTKRFAITHLRSQPSVLIFFFKQSFWLIYKCWIIVKDGN